MQLLIFLLFFAKCFTVIGAARDNSHSDCSDALDLQRRISRSLLLSDDDIGSLRGILDNVITEDECSELVDDMQPNRFVSSLGYENNYDGSSYNAPHGYSGLSLKELSLTSTGTYQRVLDIREKMRLRTEQALGMCNNTLFVHYTQVAQKTTAGKHHPHADNCFHTFHEGRAICDKKKQHPWPMRSAASILFLNDNFGGGEFYWADRSNGEPETIVKAKPGKMTYFTSGPENLHGALPVEEDREVCTTAPRRLVMAIWFTTDANEAELVPKFGDQEDPNAVKLCEIAFHDLKPGALRLTLALFFLRHQNSPASGSWTLNQPNDSMLTMLFKDHSAMLSVTIKKNAISLQRHVDASARPSLQYQLQESVLLHGFLDELDTLAFGGEDNIDQESRLLVPSDVNEIETCREILPARRA